MRNEFDGESFNRIDLHIPKGLKQCEDSHVYILYVCVCLFVALPVIMQPTQWLSAPSPSHSPATSAALFMP